MGGVAEQCQSPVHPGAQRLAIVLFTPAGSLDAPQTQFALSLAFPDARFKARESAFPLALAMAYSLAFVAAWLGALSVCFTQGHLGAFHALAQRRSLLKRIVVVLVLLYANASPFTERHLLEIQVSWHVKQAILQNRWALLVACEGLYIGLTATMAWVLYEMTNAVNAARHALGHRPRGHGPGHP